ncbi:sulfotransferase [Nonomuraea cavernae]|uniref:Uncharacterized protein n=1 Tax=Nonomuraea cavernae TaxID=2045107 RepID=A0A917YYT6_9ACTN|nr:sulfotransferase [Nonomuraea cavernae]MCA2186049.1 hypothetical protein [Nonomuraea cavernae]GGO70376.1 hypothetical protein GCM10012289_33680 [Nonomuraea cavernae]
MTDRPTEIAAGWWPLCEFLGAPMSDESFPQVNDAAGSWSDAPVAVVSLLSRRSG